MALAVLALLAAAGLATKIATSLGSRPRPNVLLITIDTLRADHVGCYGDTGASTPVLDALAARGVRFPTAVAHVPLTSPSHASILTGLTPLRHGIRDNGTFVLPEGTRTAAERFREAGYATAAFISGFPLNRRFGLARGFEAYDDRLPHGDDPRRAAYVERPADQTTDLVLRWLDARSQAEAPWFLWVHYFDPHAPYEPPKEFADRFPGRPYDGEIAFVDSQIGALLRKLDQKGLARRTLMLVTADHGESLGEHGEETHGVFVYDATLRVPWIMAGPGVPSGRVPATVARSIDVTPTLLDLAGIGKPADVEGRSLRAVVLGREMPDAPVYSESLFVHLNLGWAPLHGWRTARWQYIEAPRPELYAVDTDAREIDDRTRDHPDVAGALREQLRAALATKAPAAGVSLGAEAAERLRALGYLGGQAPREAALSSGRDPKDGIGLINRLERGMAAARSNPKAAAEELATVLVEDPKMTLAHRFRAIALSGTGDHAAAVKEVEAMDKEGAATVVDLVLLGECLRLGGRSADAIAVLEQAAAKEPKAPEPLLTLARVYATLGKNDEAAGAYGKVASLVPGHTEALRGLGDLAATRGDLETAAIHYGRILASDPHDAGAALKLGVVDARAGRLQEAFTLLHDLVEREPGDAEALLALAGVLAKSGRPTEAVPYFERAIDAGARSTVSLNGLGFARLEAGDTAGALVALRSSLALDPRQARIAQAVSQLMGGRGAPR